MKPILLYDENETTFTSNGLGSLNEAISAIVTEERNGTYELVLTYPVSGKHFADIGYSCIIKCATVPGGEYQLFRIYAISKERNGVVTINAEHISYQLSYIPVDGFTASSVVEALYKMGTNAMASCPFTFWTDKDTVARYHQEVPENIRARLGGTSGSILDVYGGEYEWDNYTVKLHNHRGANRNVTLRYGKNITDITQEENISNVYTSIVGFYKDEESGTVVKTSVIDSTYASSYPFKRTKVVDFSTDFDTIPTVQQLTTRATAYMNNNDFGIPHVNIKVSFVALWQTDEYKDVAPLERVYLCDTVSVSFEKLGITTSAKVVKTQYNVLLDKYNSIDLGETRTNLSERLANQENEIQQQIVDSRSEMEKAVNHATELLRGGLGGHVVLNTDADGKPQEILIMDSEDIATAEKVWRWNLNGFGYSSHGYDPEPPYGYGTAITMNGEIVADYITTGTLLANRVRAGLLTDELGYNYWNLSTGEFQLAPTHVILGNQTFAQYAQSVQDQIDGNITSWFYAYAPTTSNAPASTWTTVNKKIAHIGDLFYDSNTGYCYRWQVKENAVDPAHPTANDFEWVQISDEDIAAAMAAASQAQDTADHKRRVFTAQPTTPYDVGDLWCVGTNGDILTCMTARATGAYVADDWSKQNKYVDSTDISNAVSAYDTSLNQLKVFNKLTNNGQIQGIYMDDGDLYINASYIATGILADPDGNTSWNLATGALSSKKFSITSDNFTLTEDGVMTAVGATLNGGNDEGSNLNISDSTISYDYDGNSVATIIGNEFTYTDRWGTSWNMMGLALESNEDLLIKSHNGIIIENDYSYGILIDENGINLNSGYLSYFRMGEDSMAFGVWDTNSGFHQDINFDQNSTEFFSSNQMNITAWTGGLNIAARDYENLALVTDYGGIITLNGYNPIYDFDVATSNNPNSGYWDLYNDGYTKIINIWCDTSDWYIGFRISPCSYEV